MPQLTQGQLLEELEPTVAKNLDRHLSVAKEWMPHDYVPWDEGRNFAALGGEDWSPEQSRMSKVAQTALEVNLLTEDNLPSYHREIDNRFGRDGAWGTWVHQWTAEEGRHAIVIRDYLVVTRAVDPMELERGRMSTMQQGYDSGGKGVLDSIAYVSFQELATRISHRNTGTFTGEPLAEKLLARVAADENLHMIFYRDLLRAAFEVDPDQAMAAVTKEVVNFEMPGSNITGFTRKAAAIAKAGIYDLRIHHDEVVAPILRHWGVWEMTGLGPEGEQARQRLAEHMEQLDRQASRFVEQRAAAAAKLAERQAAGAAV